MRRLGALAAFLIVVQVSPAGSARTATKSDIVRTYAGIQCTWHAPDEGQVVCSRSDRKGYAGALGPSFYPSSSSRLSTWSSTALSRFAPTDTGRSRTSAVPFGVVSRPSLRLVAAQWRCSDLQPNRSPRLRAHGCSCARVSGERALAGRVRQESTFLIRWGPLGSTPVDPRVYPSLRCRVRRRVRPCRDALTIRCVRLARALPIRHSVRTVVNIVCVRPIRRPDPNADGSHARLVPVGEGSQRGRPMESSLRIRTGRRSTS